MRRKFFAIVLLFTLFTVLTYSQVTDTEKTLRTQHADSTQGWKRGGVFALNLAQTSLTNWSAGGQNSFAVNGMISTFANYKRGKGQLNGSWIRSFETGKRRIQKNG